ncbi:MAG TPA: TolC family protein [Gemmatimonadaceae bacterium]
MAERALFVLWTTTAACAVVTAVPFPRARAQSAVVMDTLSGPIDLQKAVAIALRQNTSIRQSENAVSSSAATVDSRKGVLQPSLSLTTSTARSVGRSGSTTTGGSSATSLSPGVSSSFLVFDGKRSVNQLRQARLDVLASTSDLARTRQTVVFTVASDYLTLATAQGQLAVQRENLAAQEAQEAQLQMLVKAGANSISDLYTQQSNTENARANVISAEHDVELAKIAVIQTLQLDPRRSYHFVVPTVSTAASDVRHYDLDSLLSRAFWARADLAAEQTRVDASVLGLRAAQAGKSPSVSVTSSYAASYTSTATSNLTDQLNQNRGGSVSLGVSLPIFDLGSAAVTVQQARLQEENARLTLASQRQTVALEVRRAYLTLESTRQQVSVALAQQKAADLAVSSTQARYVAGTSTLLELTQARANLVQAATAVVNAGNSLAFQDALMSYYTGELDPGAIVLVR